MLNDNKSFICIKNKTPIIFWFFHVNVMWFWYFVGSAGFFWWLHVMEYPGEMSFHCNTKKAVMIAIYEVWTHLFYPKQIVLLLVFILPSWSSTDQFYTFIMYFSICVGSVSIYLKILCLIYERSTSFQNNFVIDMKKCASNHYYDFLISIHDWIFIYFLCLRLRWLFDLYSKF